jgi:hypothetical protein
VSIARGEQDYFTKDGIPTAVEGCKSNAMMRCCKDLGVASELWDPRFVREFKGKYAKEVFVEHQVTKKRTKITLRKVRHTPHHPSSKTYLHILPTGGKGLIPLCRAKEMRVGETIAIQGAK